MNLHDMLFMVPPQVKVDKSKVRSVLLLGMNQPEDETAPGMPRPAELRKRHIEQVFNACAPLKTFTTAMAFSAVPEMDEGYVRDALYQLKRSGRITFEKRRGIGHWTVVP